MALERGKLSNIVVVSAGSTAGIITVASSKKVYVKSIAAFDVGATGVATAPGYVLPDGGTVEDNTKLFNITLGASETVLIEPSYPIVLDTTGDQISVGATGGNINFFITGDKEA